MPAAHSTPLQFDPNKLADIQLPNSISAWPIAPGWWLLLLLIVSLIGLLIYLINRKPKPKKAKTKHLKTQAMQELETIKKSYQAQPDDKNATHKSVKQLSIFLRRYALSIFKREQVAGLTDQQWLLLLDKIYNNHKSKNPQEVHLFSEKYAELLTQVPYQTPQTGIDHVLLNELFASAEKLISHSAHFFATKQSKQSLLEKENATVEHSHV